MSEITVGGQAVIEGVMIRAPERVATAVRRQDGTIVVQSQPYTALAQRRKWLNIPILRGAVAFFEMLIIGVRSLNFSAEMAARDIDANKGGQTPPPADSVESEPKGMSTVAIVLTTMVGLGAGVFLFFFIPLWISKLLGLEKGAAGFNLMAGLVRVVLLVAYVWVLSQFAEFKRLFEYHGAEHKSIFAYENAEDLSYENVKKYTTLHPRCGTSFLLIVALFAILVYSIADSIYQVAAGVPPPLLNRFALHFVLLPLVAGSSYELLKMSAKGQDRWWWRAMSAPGLWLQRITTREPDADQLEVAKIAMWSALGMPMPETVKLLNSSSPTAARLQDVAG
ncbi:MAG: DUF1385 domain-containing protein [Candidatus Zixiibacteriota bacterium]